VMVLKECNEAIHILVARLRFHEFTAFYMTQLSEESASGRCFRAWLVLIMLGLGFLLLMGGHVYRQSMHTAFWLGLLPLYALFVTMIALGVSFSIMVRIRAVQYFRHHSAAGKSKMRNQIKDTRACCEPTPRVLRLLLLLVAATAVAAVVLGGMVLKSGREVIGGLQDGHCGKSGVSQDLDRVQTKLVDFQEKCHANAESKKSLVHNCPGFREAFPDPDTKVDYLAQLEASEDCTGFCSKPPTPLFTAKLPAPSIHGAAPNPACVQIVQHEVALASVLMGALPIVLGSLLCVKSCLLFDFDHL